jgi:hypothetical protein
MCQAPLRVLLQSSQSGAVLARSRSAGGFRCTARNSPFFRAWICARFFRAWPNDFATTDLGGPIGSIQQLLDEFNSATSRLALKHNSRDSSTAQSLHFAGLHEENILCPLPRWLWRIHNRHAGRGDVPVAQSAWQLRDDWSDMRVRRTSLHMHIRKSLGM